MRIVIGTPAYDGKLHVRYVHGLAQTLKSAKEHGIEVDHMFIPNNSILQNARNIIFHEAHKHGYDYLVFIDADIGWEFSELKKLLSTGLDVVGGAYRLKTDRETTYAVKKMKHSKMNGTLIEVDFIATGFLAISKKAIEKTYKKSKKYSDGSNKDLRLAFDMAIENGELNGEDTFFCRNWRRNGGKIFCETSIRLDHIGDKVFKGDVNELQEAVMYQAGK